MNTHRTLVRSAVIATVGACLPTGVAHADTTLYATSASFETAVAADGMSQMYVETFEENTLGGGYANLGPSVSYGVPNGPFPTGLDAEGLTIRSAGGGNMALTTAGYFPNITSHVVGALNSNERTTLEFADGGVKAVGMILTGYATFIGGIPDEFHYDVKDPDGITITTGTWPAPNAETGTFFGLTSTDPIGSIEVRGTRFGSFDEVEVVANIQAWIDPPPAPVLFATASAFQSAATDAGLAEKYTETFEENTLEFGGSATLTNTLTYGVANGPFPTGLDAEGLTIRSVNGGNLGANAEGALPNLTSTVVGPLSGNERTAVDFDGGVTAVSMKLTGIATFIGGIPDEFHYDVKDMDGNVITTGTWPAPDAETGTFFGITSPTPIGSIELRGTRFGSLDEVELVDDIQVWDEIIIVPGDVNADGSVNVDDLVAVISAWGVCGGCPEDIDGDGDVDVDDLVTVITNWG